VSSSAEPLSALLPMRGFQQSCRQPLTPCPPGRASPARRGLLAASPAARLPCSGLEPACPTLLSKWVSGCRDWIYCGVFLFPSAALCCVEVVEPSQDTLHLMHSNFPSLTQLPVALCEMAAHTASALPVATAQRNGSGFIAGGAAKLPHLFVKPSAEA